MILNSKWGVFYDPGKEERSRTFYNLLVLETSDDFWDRVRRLGSEIWKR